MKHRSLTNVLGIIIACISMLVFFAVSGSVAEAGTNDNVKGYAWSANIGWISLNNCTDPLEPSTCEGDDYGVNYDPENNTWSGKGWNDNIGWINFGVSGGPGAGPWAKAEIGGGAGSGGWDGWIDLSGVSLPNSNSGAPFVGYGWSGEDLNGNGIADIGIGWVQFSNYAFYVDENACRADSSALTISASPGSVNELDPSTLLRWGSADEITFDSCTASGDWSGSVDVPENGNTKTSSETVGPDGATFEIECVTPGASPERYCAQTSVNYRELPPDAIILGGSKCVRPGVAGRLTWSSTGDVGNCTADWSGSVSSSGTTTVTPAESGQTYTITCDAGYSSSHTIDVDPSCSNFLIPDINEV